MMMLMHHLWADYIMLMASSPHFTRIFDSATICALTLQVSGIAMSLVIKLCMLQNSLTKVFSNCFALHKIS